MVLRNGKGSKQRNISSRIERNAKKYDGARDTENDRKPNETKEEKKGKHQTAERSPEQHHGYAVPDKDRTKLFSVVPCFVCINSRGERFQVLQKRISTSLV